MTNKQKRRSVRRERRADSQLTRGLINMLCEGIAEGDAEAEDILTNWQPEGHRMAGYVRYMKRGPAGLLTQGVAR